MDYSYYTFPVLVIAMTGTLYAWQEPRIKKLEKGRDKRIQKTVKDLFGAENINRIEDKVHKFLRDDYTKYSDILMPIRKFVPYRKIGWSIVFSFVFATIGALYRDSLQEITFFSFSADSIVNYSIAFSCVYSSLLLYGEFKYMQRIINLFDDHSYDE